MKMKFDKDNFNILILYEYDLKGRYKWYSIAIPPIKSGSNRTDILWMSEHKHIDYEYNSDAIIIMTNRDNRYAYHNGYLMAHTRIK